MPRSSLSSVRSQNLGEYAWPLLDLLVEQPIVTTKVTTKHVCTRLGATPSTVGRLLDDLAALGIVDEVTGRRRNRVYRYSPFLDILADGPEPA